MEDEIMSLLFTAGVQHERGDLAGSISLYEKILSLSPDHPDATHLLGVARGGQEGVQLIVRAINRNPRAGPYWGNLAELVRRQGDPQASIPIFKIAKALDLGDVSCRLNLGIAYAQTGAFSDSVAEFEALITSGRAMTAARVCLADVLVAMGRTGEARAQAQRVLDSEPENQQARELLKRTSDNG